MIDPQSIRIISPAFRARLGSIQHVLFDFDGTISLLRQGWEGVMVPMMMEMIQPDGSAIAQIEAEVRQYVDDSTGILTIHQMEWLAQAVKRYGFVAEALSAREYKAEYVKRILRVAEERGEAIRGGSQSCQEHMVAGAERFLKRLSQRGIDLYLASGTDHADVVREAKMLGVEPFFGERIYGALDESEAHDKGAIIQRILQVNQLEGSQLLVIGDGPVEMRVAVRQGALALGAATDEIARHGWNEHKVQRLLKAGADALIADFQQDADLEAFLWP